MLRTLPNALFQSRGEALSRAREEIRSLEEQLSDHVAMLAQANTAVNQQVAAPMVAKATAEAIAKATENLCQ